MENEVLREVVRLSLKGSITSASAASHDSPPQGDSPRQKLVDGMLYSRKFILTYHAIIVAIVLLLSLANCGNKLLRWRRRITSKRTLPPLHVDVSVQQDPMQITSWKKGSDHDLEEVSSSGSSTLEGSSSPPQKDTDEDEETPLLGRNFESPQIRKSPIRFVEAFLMYQLPPIPFFNKILPSNGSSIVILSFLGLNLFYCLYNLEFTPTYIFVIADRFGIVFIANLPLLYLLAAKNQPLKFLTGRSYESLNIFHRRLGELLCFLALLHGIGMTTVWYVLIRPRGLDFAHFLALPVIIFGLGAFLSYELLYFTSLGSFRQRWYELFLGIHIIFQVSALGFLYFHHPIGRPYVLIAVGIFLVDRFIYRYAVKSTSVIANAKLMEDEETVKLSMCIPPQTGGFKISRLLGKSITAGWKPTDHVFVTISALGKDHIIQAHPFTISSAAPTPVNADATLTLELLIRSQTGFSRDLLHYVHRHNTLTLRLDGPYGSSHARDVLSSSDLSLVVAGGSGIAVAWPLIEHLSYLSSVSSDQEAPQSRFTRRKVVLIWIVHQAAHLSWLSQHDLEMARSKGVEVVIPPATEEAGRPNLRGLIEGFVDKHGTTRGCRARTGVVASGPDGMGRLVRNTCAALVREGRDVDVVIEKFGW